MENERLPPGLYRTRWDRRSEGGRRVSAGVYFLRMRGPGFAATRKVLVLE